MDQAIQETEVFVAGGGPAGLAAALAARQAGFDVIVVDRGHPPIDKACGEGIMPDGLAALRRLGVCLDSPQGTSFAGIRFINGEQEVQASFHNGTGFGIRRTVLHQELVNAATRAGVRLLWDRRVTGFADRCVLVNGETIRCCWVIGADGEDSRIRQLVGLGHAGAGKVRFGFRQHFQVKLWSEFVEVHWSDCGQMYVTPVADDAVCVAFITSQKTLRFDQAVRHFPSLALHLKDATPQDRPRGAVTASRCLERVHREHVALIGEAAGSVDAITGEGLAITFQQATALADALRANNLSLYEAAVRRIMRLPHAMATLMLSMDRHAAFRRRVFRAFEAQPEIFARMLAVHTGALRPINFGLGNTFSLGWHLLTEKG